MEDNCIICAEPLAFTAYGSCGHKETCSKCVIRMRTVIKDLSCAYCRQNLPAVFVTRFAGDYTQQISPAEFENLKDRAAAGELKYLDSAQAYFDDPSHYDEVRALCGLTHPLAGSKVFTSLRALKSHLQTHCKRNLCDICLEGRNVFTAEQIAYTKAELDRHMRQGDVDGPMAETVFKGHPECRFCRKRFYGENEIYNHMISSHEECFLCKRAAPHRHVYYRDYPDLENHFRQQHYPCEHPSCLEQKFVVFPTEQELKTHTAREHGQTLSKMERKQALTLPVSFNYRRGNERDSSGGGASSSTAASNLAAVAASGQRAVVIGGAASVPSQLGGRRGSRPNMAAVEQQAIAAAAAAANASGSSQASGGGSGAGGAAPTEEVAGLSLRETDFPSMVAPNVAGHAVGGRWAGSGGGPSTSAGFTNQDFPALPGTSKSAKRRAAKKQTAAQVVGGGGSVRVINAGSGSGIGGAPALGQDNFPSLSATPLRRDELEWQPVQRRAPLPRPPSSQEVAEPTPAPPSPVEAAVARRRQQKKQQREQTQPPPIPPPAAVVSETVLPTLVPPGGTASGGISAALRSANKELVSKIKTRLGDGDEFNEFRKQSTAWVKGETSSKDYHKAISALGLVNVVPELAATCPDAAKRNELLEVHASAFIDRPPPAGGSAAGKWMPPEAAAAGAAHAAANSSWTCETCTLVNAPSAVVCEACGVPKPRKELDANSQWKQQQPSTSSRASAKAAPKSAAAIVAGTASASATPAAPVAPVSREEMFPALPSASRPSGSSSAASASNGAGSSGGGGKKKKGGKQKLGLQDFMQQTKVHPQNAWKNPNLKGQWASAGAGRLAQEERALNDSWAKQ